MQLIIKVLKGGECQLEVDEEISVLELKKEISKTLNIPVPRQKILHVGRTLPDDKALSAFQQIKSGSKLTVVIREPEPLKDVMCKIFKKYYSDEQSEAMAKEFMLDLDKRLEQLSLDDFERMAAYFLERDRKLYGDT
ncbi:ubiquitin-like protein 4A [Sitodiplosis mosellana]|uniref:ubiquitin-like protein 4A n=1 Tax=Sitodiplosis mosellana TaxID=263140 RepID=UPI002443D26D|nr:ubiquitin-like protein 4A [Sitodiplosis mosellana]